MRDNRPPSLFTNFESPRIGCMLAGGIESIEFVEDGKAIRPKPDTVPAVTPVRGPFDEEGFALLACQVVSKGQSGETSADD